MSELRQRVLTAVPLLVGLLLLLFAAPVRVVVAAGAVLIAMGAWEWSAFAGWRLPLERSGYVAGILLAMAAVGWLVPEVIGLAAVLWTALFWWVLAFFWILRYPTPVPSGIAAIAGLLVLVPAWLSMITILSVPRSGPQLLLLVLCIVFAADVGAYFAGRRFGRVKLAPRVSPGKTWEGLIGGLLLAGLAAALGGRLLGLPVSFMAVTGLGIAVLSVIGDLTESMFKRSVGLKDSSHLIPGHGGVLDRLDSVAPALPTYALALSWLGILS